MGLFDRFRKNQSNEASFAAQAATPEEVEADLADKAERFIDAFTGEGSGIERSKLDYSEASLEVVDEILGDFHDSKAKLSDGLHLAISSYVFEVARRAFGGRYVTHNNENPFVLLIEKNGASVGVFVMGKVRGRVKNGPEDNIPFFYAGIAPLVERGESATLI